MHHFSSFNNQWYRKSIEYMQDVDRHAAVEVVRRLPRSRGVLQRPLRSADQGADRHAGSAGRARLHVVPLDRARRQHDGPGRLHDRISAAARSRRQRAIRCCAFVHDLLTYLDPEPHRETFLKPFMREQTAEFCSTLPQGAPRRAGEQLPLVPRLQRLRQLAGERRLGPGRALVLLPAEAAEVRRLPHAAGRARTIRRRRTARSTRTASPPRTPRCRSSTTTRRS